MKTPHTPTKKVTAPSKHQTKQPEHKQVSRDLLHTNVPHKHLTCLYQG